jgi:hypothetical protein
VVTVNTSHHPPIKSTVFYVSSLVGMFSALHTIFIAFNAAQAFPPGCIATFVVLLLGEVP